MLQYLFVLYVWLSNFSCSFFTCSLHDLAICDFQNLYFSSFIMCSNNSLCGCFLNVADCKFWSLDKYESGLDSPTDEQHNIHKN